MKRLTVTIYCLLVLAAAKAQFRFLSYNVSDGLSQNSVTAIYQDINGLLWLGTQDGLNSFDGHTFKTYKYDEKDTTTISDQFILSITEDKQGFLWVATRNGYNRFNKRTGKFTRYYSIEDEKQGLGRSYANLSHDQQGNILVDCGYLPEIVEITGTGLIRKKFSRYVFNPCFDKNGDVWGIDRNRNLSFGNHLANYKIVTVKANPPASLRTAGTLKTSIDAKQVLWCYPFLDKGRVFFFDIAKGRWKDRYVDIPEVINDLNITADGTGWVSTLKGIYLVKDYALSRFLTYDLHNTSGLPPGSISCSYQDRQGNIWVGSANAGFAYYHADFDNFSLVRTGIENDAVTAMVITPQQEWIGAASGLYQLSGYRQLPTIRQHLFSNKRVTALTTDSTGKIWVAIQKEGLYILNAAGKTEQSIFRNDTLLQTKNILHLSCDSYGRVWVCTERGFYVYDNRTKKWTSFYEDNLNHPSGYYILHAFEDRQHRTWLSKNMGIEVYDEKLNLLFAIPSNTASSPVNRTIITAITQDAYDNIWIATLSSGLYVYNQGIKHHYTNKDGLNSNVIYGVASDKKGRIWVTTTSGINIFDPLTHRFFSLSSKDGLPADDYMLGALKTNEQGDILIGTSKGLVTVKANDISFRKKDLEAYPSDIKVNGESIETLMAPLVLHSGYKTISFDFSVKQALQPRNIVYQYRMQGSDAEWNTLSSGNTRITYSGLPFKKLVMQVKAGYTPQDLKDAPVTEFMIDVRPAFWQTKWFIALIIIAAALLINFLVQLYTKQKYKKRLQEIKNRQQLQLERERIGRDLHDNIGAYTSALIAGLQEVKKNNGEKGDQLDELSEYAAGIMDYLRETIWVLNHQTPDLTAFCDRFINYAGRITRHYPHITLEIKERVTTERTLTPQLSLNLFRILQEALQNACKHATASVIEIGFTSNQTISLYIKDNGIGITEREKADTYGLQNMMQRADETGFDLQIISEKDLGTTVLVTEK